MTSHYDISSLSEDDCLWSVTVREKRHTEETKSGQVDLSRSLPQGQAGSFFFVALWIPIAKFRNWWNCIHDLYPHIRVEPGWQICLVEPCYSWKLRFSVLVVFWKSTKFRLDQIQVPSHDLHAVEWRRKRLQQSYNLVWIYSCPFAWISTTYRQAEVWGFDERYSWTKHSIFQSVVGSRDSEYQLQTFTSIVL